MECVSFFRNREIKEREKDRERRNRREEYNVERVIEVMLEGRNGANDPSRVELYSI